ncbi:nucleoside hydrolase [Paramicrobacterium fandaimingii]|uniref:nucleoside hydrolase n=1 Tax=Paramicrobacterium fandaimingii TaxID=2708079 RepID=UPI00141F551A|nr:nucleoside hydrolase [Microbacterium fandaimingii]
MTRPVYFDCDTGVDDSMALAYLLASPEIDLVGIGGVHGNVSAAQGVTNTLRLLALADRGDVPVAVGRNDPLVGEFAGGAPHVHGVNGIGNIEIPATSAMPIGEDAADLLLRLSHEYDGNLEVVAVGPLTNLAVALHRDPSLAERVVRVTAMGGAALVPGNITPLAEANIAHDPEAAQAVMAASWPVTLVPLDTTLANVLDEDDRERLCTAEAPIVRAVGAALDYYFDFYVDEYGRRCSALHDPLAAAIAVGGMLPRVAPAVPVEVDVTDGPGRGQTVCDLRGQRLGPVDHPGANVRLVLETEGPLAPHMVERLLSLTAPVATVAIA